MLNIKQYSPLKFYIFFGAIFAYLLFSSISNAILIDEERKIDNSNNDKPSQEPDNPFLIKR